MTISEVVLRRRARPLPYRRQLDIIIDAISRVQELVPAIDLFAVPLVHRPGLRQGEGANAITYHRQYQDGHYEICNIVFDDEFLATATDDELRRVAIHE